MRPMADPEIPQFEQAVADSKQLPEKPDNMTLLQPVCAVQAGQQRAMWTASAPASPTWWAAPSGTPGMSLKGTAQADEAMQEYIDLIESLK